MPKTIDDMIDALELLEKDCNSIHTAKQDSACILVEGKSEITRSVLKFKKLKANEEAP